MRNPKPTADSNAVAAYYRFSSEGQREESIEAQQRAVKDYCQRNGLTVVKERMGCTSPP